MPTAVPLPADEAGLLDLLTEARLAQAAPMLSRWFSPDQLRATLREDLHPELERRSSDALAALYRQHAPVEGVDHDSAYKNRILTVPPLGTALVGIRFRGMDLARPFVTAAATTRLPDEAGLTEAAALLRQEFEAFRPRHLRLFVPAGVPIDLSALPPGSHWDHHLLAAPVTELRARPLPAFHARVQLQVPPDMGFYPQYVQAYEALFAANPSHREFTHAEAEEDLEELRQEGLVFEVRVDGAWAGVVAACRSSEQGVSGFVVTEMFLDAAHRGQGLGPAVGRHLLDRLPAESGDTLFGTIHHDNLPARRSAERGGRTDVGAFLWVAMPG
ncbi:GNAT family N-acetyltransferase [Deinococcus sonorensis]|uniref:GNAT family N-acetyltransferase n=2 Tax=Deinococcus sonorensis TaxID=309891 RepID=A0AAU7UAQ3_9DEIO